MHLLRLDLVGNLLPRLHRVEEPLAHEVVELLYTVLYLSDPKSEVARLQSKSAIDSTESTSTFQ